MGSVMTADASRLLTPLAKGDLLLTPLAEAHRAALADACAADRDIWQIYASNFGPPDFDRNFKGLLANPGRLAFAVLQDGTLVGMTAYLRLDLPADTLEIGNTYLARRRAAPGSTGG